MYIACRKLFTHFSHVNIEGHVVNKMKAKVFYTLAGMNRGLPSSDICVATYFGYEGSRAYKYALDFHGVQQETIFVEVVCRGLVVAGYQWCQFEGTECLRRIEPGSSLLFLPKGHSHIF